MGELFVRWKVGKNWRLYWGSIIGFSDPAILPILSCYSCRPALLYVEIPIPPKFLIVFYKFRWKHHIPFTQYITERQVFMVDVFVVSILPLMTLMCILLVLSCFSLSCSGISEKERLLKIVCYGFLGPAFWKTTNWIFKGRGGCAVVAAFWFWSEFRCIP